jgi:hypothetical protein
LLKDLVESANASKSSCQRNLCHRQSRVLKQLLGEKYPPGLGDRDRGSAKVLPKQTSKLTLANSQPCRQVLHLRVIEAPRFD